MSSQSTRILLDHFVSWRVENAEDWYRNPCLIDFVEQATSNSFNEAQVVGKLYAAMEGICHFPKSTRNAGHRIQLEKQHDRFSQTNQPSIQTDISRLHSLMDEKVLAEVDKAGSLQGDSENDTDTVSSKSTTGARHCDLALRVFHEDVGVVALPMLMEAKKGTDVSRLTRRGFFQSAWYLVVAFRTYGCKLAALTVNDTAQRYVVLNEHTMAVEFSADYQSLDPSPLSVIALTTLGPFTKTSMPLMFPKLELQEEFYQIVFRENHRTAIDRIHHMYCEGVRECIRFVANALQLSPTLGISSESNIKDDFVGGVKINLSKGAANDEGDLYGGTENCAKRVRDAKKLKKKASKDAASDQGGQRSRVEDDDDTEGSRPAKRGSGTAAGSTSKSDGTRSSGDSKRKSITGSSRSYKAFGKGKQREAQAEVQPVVDSEFLRPSSPTVASASTSQLPSPPPMIPVADDSPANDEDMADFKSAYLAEQSLRQSGFRIRVVTSGEMDRLVAMAYS